MKTQYKAILWAVAILAVAAVCRFNGIGQNETFALIIGLTAAAWATLNKRSCRAKSSD